MQSINFDDGYKSFAINNDENRVIKFNPSDPDIIRRFDEGLKAIEKKKKTLDTDMDIKADGTPDVEENELENAAKLLTEFNEVLKEQLNHMFNSDVFDTIFGNQSPLSLVKKGREKMYLFEAFLTAAMPIIEKEFEAYNKESEKRISKYTKYYHK